MTDRPYLESQTPAARIRAFILTEMLRGFFLAAVFVLGIAAILVAIWAVGLLLPEESKQAPPPYTQLPQAADIRPA